jgi:hypothetical protein
MNQKPSERPIWFLPLVGFLIPVGVGGIFLGFQALQWSGGEKGNIVEQNPPQPPSSPGTPRVTTNATAPVSVESASKGLPDSEHSLYASEINRLSIKAKEYSRAVEEVRRIDASGTGEGVGSGESIKADGIARYQAQGSHKTSLVNCLENQRKLGVLFYEGKATCTTALPEPVTPQLN